MLILKDFLLPWGHQKLDFSFTGDRKNDQHLAPLSLPSDFSFHKMNSCAWRKFISLVFSEHWLNAGLVLGIGVTEMNVRLSSFWNSQSIEGSRQVNRQLQYYGKGVTKVCMGMIGKVRAIINREKQGCLKQIMFWIRTGEESFFFVLNNWSGPLKCW